MRSIAHPLHELPSAKNEQKVRSDSGHDGFLGGEGTAIGHPSSKLERRGREVESVPSGSDGTVDGTRSWCPGGKGRQLEHGSTQKK